MTDTYRDWHERVHSNFGGIGFRTYTGETPYSLGYGMKAVIPGELEVTSLRGALESEITTAEWTRGRVEQPRRATRKKVKDGRKRVKRGKAKIQ